MITVGVGVYITHKPMPKLPKQEEKKTEVGPLLKLDDFLVNLIDYGGRRYLKISMELELNGPKTLEEAEKKKAIIRNYIINILSSQTFDDIKNEEGKNNLRKRLLLKINFILKEGHATNVYFSNFIIQ